MALTDSVEDIVANSNNPLLAKHESWSRVKLGDIAKVQNGFAFKSALFTKENRGMPIIRIRDVGSDNTETYYTGEYDPEYIVREGDLLIGMDGDFNSARWKGPDALLNQRVCRIIPTTDAYEPGMLDFALPGYLKAINEVTSSVTVKHLSSRTVAEIPLPLPPRAQQRRIVQAIETQLGRLDAAVARLQQAKAHLKRYKQAVLKAAYSGKFTGTFTADDSLPEGWSTATTDDLFQYVTSGSRGWAKYYADEGALFLRITNMDFDTLDLDLEPQKIQRVYLKDVREGMRTRVQQGDLLISITGYLGMIALVDQEIEEAYVNQHIALARPFQHYNTRYVGYYLTAEEGGRRQFNLAGKGATKAGLTLPDIKALRVPMAPREEQDRVVEEIEHRLSAVGSTESTLDAQLEQSTRLRQAVLKRAFEGRLV